MTNLMPEDTLDLASIDQRAGFRLERFEVFNWGTFHDRVWGLAPGGNNSLLTGDIGSGKSTLVDALTTLLVPAQSITYNKAAGADSRERTLRSYVLGHYKSERGEEGLAARSVALRDHNSYSVILGHFFNEGYDRHVTLAQVFWIRGAEGQPARFYVVTDRPLTIVEDFAGFGPDIKDLRKRLRSAQDVELHETFPPYGAAFRRRFGIETAQALELFNQTVSLKSVGNLTDFVRSHMLEAFAVEARIQALISHFDDLDRAHEAVVKAKEMIASLEPLVIDADRHAKLTGVVTNLRDCRMALSPWFAHLKRELLEQRIARLVEELQILAARLGQLEHQRREQRSNRDALKQAIAENGGDRLERIQSDIDRLEQQKTERGDRARAYGELARRIKLPEPNSEVGFRENRVEIDRILSRIEDEESEIQNSLTEASVTLRDLNGRYDILQVELASLRQRQSNLPDRILILRDRLCSEADLPIGALPFAGELIQVHQAERDWEGAIERVLHNFALSLLVPEGHYRTVAEWVDRTHLRGRLVYYRVRERRDERIDLHPDSLVRKLSIQPDSPFYRWLEQSLAKRFDYACCIDLDRFRREQKAITYSGQTKAPGERHEKDDRHLIDDRTRYVLGWDNAAKIAAFEKQAKDVKRQLLDAEQLTGSLEAQRKLLRERSALLHQMGVYREFRELDWRPLTLEIHGLKEERRDIEASSDLLRTLQERLAAVERELESMEADHKTTVQEEAKIQTKRTDADQMLGEVYVQIEATPEDMKARYFPQLEVMRPDAVGEHSLTVESCDRRQTEMREWLQVRIDTEGNRINRLRDRIIDSMRSYKTRWPVETSDVDVSIEAVDEYRTILDRLRVDDLPRFESDFKALLNENTIREVASFQAQLGKESQQIKERIGTINLSLREIDYNPNRYIILLAESAHDAEITAFRLDLKACTAGALTGSDKDPYSEAKFLQVKAIIERFRGREGQTEIDSRWTRKVTDVRNWFVFSVSERWREDESEFEHYRDSGGKSGGQKEKLAYTVLAASLAYQFGLEWGEQRSRSFRFVAIDEAFGRGSDESTRYALELFKRLNLQLLIVTPLQKIHIIEPFVSSVGFVHNEDGRNSLLRNLTIKEYRAELAARKMITVS